MTVKVGLIGCGSITELRHAPEYKANKNVEIVGFCDPMLSRAEKLASAFGGKAFPDYKEMLDLKDLDAVSVCTTNSTHASISIEALKAGKHVLCEKPMATTLEDAKAMIDTAAEYGKFLMIGHNQRFVDGHITAKKILKSGELGKILTFRTTFGHAGPEMWSADKGKHTWFFKKGASFIGALGDLGIHKTDLVRWLIEDEIDEVCAMTATRDKKNENNELIDVEDNALCVLRSRSGIIGSMNASWTFYGNSDNGTVLYCENGTLYLYDNPEYQVAVKGKNGKSIYYKTDKIQTNDAPQKNSGVIDAFIESVVTGKKPEISGEEGYEALSIVLACLESYEKKQFIKVRHVRTENDLEIKGIIYYED